MSEMIPLPLAILLLLILLLLSAFFSGSETALTRARKTRLRMLKNSGDKGAQHAEQLLKTPETMLSAILLGNNFVNFAASSLTAAIFVLTFGEAGIIYATIVMTIVVVVFSEVLPKTIAVAYAEPIACKVALPLQWIMRLFGPLISALMYFVNALKKPLNIASQQDTGFTHQELATMVNLSAETGTLDGAREQMLANSLKLHEVPVKSLMTPRKSMTMLDANLSVNQCKQAALEQTHSRYPVYQSERDEILGILHLRDLMRLPDSNQPLAECMPADDVPYVPANSNALSQLFDFQARQQHMAIIVDEFGDIEGLITLEDILEDIVGDIVDEHDAPQTTETWVQADGSLIVSGTANVHDINQLLDTSIPEEHATTIGGVIVHILGVQPEDKMCLNIDTLHIEILSLQDDRIQKVRITRKMSESPMNG